MHKTIMQTYNPIDVLPEKATGVWLWDQAGNKYLDALAGIAVTNIGHSHPEFIAAVSEQLHKIIHTSNILTVPLQARLADQLCNLTDMDAVFYANSGAEANECALKIARLHGHNRGIDVPTTLVTEKAFHGRTLATVSASGSRKVQAGFEPLVQGFVRVPFNDLAAVEAAGQNNSNIVAIFVEPIQGEGGVCLPDDDYLNGLRALCDENNWLLMLDEVQTGAGRTGQLYAFQHSDILPDVFTSAKGLGNGVPIGACLARGEAAKVLQVGNHGTTFGGSPLACTAALSVLHIMQTEGLLDNAKQVGAYLVESLRQHLLPLENVVAVRGQGLMLGVEINRPCRALLSLGAAQGLLFSIAGGNTIRLTPPLTLSRSEADYIVEKLAIIIPQFTE